METDRSPLDPPTGKGRVVRAERFRCESACEPSIGAGVIPIRTPAMRVCASSVSPVFGGPTETKKARHRRCFKPPIFCSRRPQARANLGSADVCALPPRCKRKLWEFPFCPRDLRCAAKRAHPQKRRGGPSRPSDRPPIGSVKRQMVQSRAPALGIASSSFLHEAGPGVVVSVGVQGSSRKAVLAQQHCARRVTPSLREPGRYRAPASAAGTHSVV
jgi:hypothetical protein